MMVNTVGLVPGLAPINPHEKSKRIESRDTSRRCPTYFSFIWRQGACHQKRLRGGGMESLM